MYYYEASHGTKRIKLRSVSRKYIQKMQHKLYAISESFNDNHYGYLQAVVIPNKDFTDLKEYLYHTNTKYTEQGNAIIIHMNRIIKIMRE